MNRKQKLHTGLREGYTTGTCACAVAKASAYMLMEQRLVSHVSVQLPGGSEVVLELEDSRVNPDSASCSTIKDAGDDPDITDGVKVIAQASFAEGDEIQIKAGEGIGVVTKPGLEAEVGKPAINPTPLKMIHESVREVVAAGTGMEITISIPEGVELARKTFNPRLGIEGGISVLGTTGIVKPMSEDALKESLVIKLKQQAAWGWKKTILAPGNYGKTFSSEKLKYDKERIVLTSNYIGYMLEQAVLYEFTDLVLVGHIGKLTKLAGGVFQTHSRTADARNEIFAAHYFKHSRDPNGFEAIMNANTTEEAVRYVDNKGFWSHLVGLIKYRAEQHVYDELHIEIVLFSHEAGLLAATENALNLFKEVMNDQ